MLSTDTKTNYYPWILVPFLRVNKWRNFFCFLIHFYFIHKESEFILMVVQVCKSILDEWMVGIPGHFILLWILCAHCQILWISFRQCVVNQQIVFWIRKKLNLELYTNIRLDYMYVLLFKPIWQSKTIWCKMFCI